MDKKKIFPDAENDMPEKANIKWEKAREYCMAHEMPKAQKNLKPFRAAGYIAAALVLTFAVVVLYNNLSRKVPVTSETQNQSESTVSNAENETLELPLPELSQSDADEQTESEETVPYSSHIEDTETEEDFESDTAYFSDIEDAETEEDAESDAAYSSHVEKLSSEEATIQKYLDLEFNYDEGKAMPSGTIIDINEDLDKGAVNYIDGLYYYRLQDIYGDTLSSDLINITYLFITSDSSIVKFDCHRFSKKCELSENKITKLRENEYQFDITLSITNSDYTETQITGSGTVQLDDDGLINFFSLSESFKKKLNKLLEE